MPQIFSKMHQCRSNGLDKLNFMTIQVENSHFKFEGQIALQRMPQIFSKFMHYCRRNGLDKLNSMTIQAENSHFKFEGQMALQRLTVQHISHEFKMSFICAV